LGKIYDAERIFFIISILISAGGAIVLSPFSFPAAWLTGGFVGGAAIIAIRGRLNPPAEVVNVSYVILGAVFGGSVSPTIVAQSSTWAVTIMVSGVSLLILMGATTLYLKHCEHWDFRTAFFSSMPGALPIVLSTAGEYLVDQRRIALLQTIRLFFFMTFLPLVARFQLELGVGGAADDTQIRSFGEAALVLTVASAGAVAARWARLPGGLMVGAMISAGLLYGTGAVDGMLPKVLENFAQMIIGIVVGVHLARLRFSDLISHVRAASISLSIATFIAAIFSWAAASVSGLPFVQLLLAFAPGAMEGMVVLGFSLGFDPAFITVHHMSRYILVVITLPLVTRQLIKK
jgi:uncharacterized protein